MIAVNSGIAWLNAVNTVVNRDYLVVTCMLGNSGDNPSKLPEAPARVARQWLKAPEVINSDAENFSKFAHLAM